MSIKALQGYTRYSKYARLNTKTQKRDSWTQQIARVESMHEEYYGNRLDGIRSRVKDSFQAVVDKKVLGSQRSLQFGGDPILRKNERIYNCTASYCDRPRFFQEAMFLALCGCGVGFSVQKHHVAMLPNITPRIEGDKEFVIPDTIEGWSDALGVLMCSYFKSDDTPFPEFRGFRVRFDFSNIRPEGSPISWGGVAPGPDGLRTALKSIERHMDALALHRDRLRPIDAYDCMMHAMDAVLSGGIRRSATICLFSPNDKEMLEAKTGRWHMENPQRARSNNSVILVRNKTSREFFNEIKKSTQQFGEPGFMWVDDKDCLANPCVEIGLYSYAKRKEVEHLEGVEEFLSDQKGREKVSGWQFCNLCEINGKKAKTPEKFYEACEAAAVIGTLQAGYNKFPYLGPITEFIIDREALLGVSITGMMDSPDVLFDPEVQKKGARRILKVNEEIAKEIGINPCARATCVKPAGTTSCILGTSSGIHPHHAVRYFRRSQGNKREFPVRHFEKHNPLAVEESCWSKNHTDKIITFLCEVPKSAKTKNQVNALKLLEYVKLTQQNWVEAGTRHETCVKPWLRHNVSNTINIQPQEWDDVFNFIYNNRWYFAGVSMIAHLGDRDYPQAPFTEVLAPSEMAEKYGNGMPMSSGLIVDGLRAFQDHAEVCPEGHAPSLSLWAACSCALGEGEIIKVEDLAKKIEYDHKTLNGFSPWNSKFPLEGDAKVLDTYTEEELEMYLLNSVKYLDSKRDWVRRARKFADRYFNGDLRQTTYCLKDVHNWKHWCDLKREYVEIDWSEVVEDNSYTPKANEQGAEACAGGKCELGDFGYAMEEKGNLLA